MFVLPLPFHILIDELTSPGELSLEEGEEQSFTVCLSVMETVEDFIWRQFAIDTFPGVAGSAKGSG